jgi:hypothetical protein
VPLSERLRDHFAKQSAADPTVEALVVEACRIVDRLDQIDAIITGKTEWIQLMRFRTRNEDAQEVTVTLDGVLAEARQQSAALKALMMQLGVGKADMSGKAEGTGDPLDEITARRAARGGSTARAGRASRGAS